MAQPKKTAQFQDDPDDLNETAQAMDTDQFPEEFSHDGTDSALTDDALEAVGLGDMEARDAGEYKKINPPPGEWVKEEEWQFKKFTNAQDSLPGDLDPVGRTLLTFLGRPKVRVVDGEDYDPVMTLRLSPDIRYKQDEPDKVDSAYRLWLQAKELYLGIKGAKPKTLGDIIKMLRYDEYTVRSMRGDSGPVILDIKAKRTGRGTQR